MKLIQLLCVLLLCVSAPAFAKGKPAPAPAPVHHESSDSTIHWNVQGPFQLIDGTAMFGANISGDYFVMHEVSVGGESGFMIGSSNSITFWEIPIVVTGKYHFSIASAPHLRPYAGAGLGLSMFHGGGGTVTVGTTTVGSVGSSTDAKFRFEAKGGLAFQEGPGLMAEIKLGVVGSGFLFAPSIGWEF